MGLTTREQVIVEAARHGITLWASDITEPEPGDVRIDGMPAADWIAAMTMD